MSSEFGNCAICGAAARQCCSACKNVKYCGVEHQKKHWKIHKGECQAYAIGKNDIVGRYLFATRDVPESITIFTEFPLVIGPKWYLTENEENSPIIPCVGCFTPIEIGNCFCPEYVIFFFFSF